MFTTNKKLPAAQPLSCDIVIHEIRARITGEADWSDPAGGTYYILDNSWSGGLKAKYVNSDGLEGRIFRIHGSQTDLGCSVEITGGHSEPSNVGQRSFICDAYNLYCGSDAGCHHVHADFLSTRPASNHSTSPTAGSVMVQLKPGSGCARANMSFCVSAAAAVLPKSNSDDPPASDAQISARCQQGSLYCWVICLLAFGALAHKANPRSLLRCYISCRACCYQLPCLAFATMMMVMLVKISNIAARRFLLARACSGGQCIRSSRPRYPMLHRSKGS